jgi:hypothetical protein
MADVMPAGYERMLDRTGDRCDQPVLGRQA